MKNTDDIVIYIFSTKHIALKSRIYYLRFRSARANFSTADVLMHGFANRRASHTSFQPFARATHNRRSLLPLLRPPIAASAAQISSRYGAGCYFQVFLRRRSVRCSPLSRCLCPIDFTVSLHPRFSSTSRKKPHACTCRLTIVSAGFACQNRIEWIEPLPVKYKFNDFSLISAIVNSYSTCGTVVKHYETNWL